MKGQAKSRGRLSLAGGAAAVLLAGMLGGQGCLGYLVRAGCGQADILWKRRPIRQVLGDPAVAPSVKARLEHVLEVQKFARSGLHLRPGTSYTLYSDIGRDAAAYNVSAAPELGLKPHTWWFPFVGTVPYLGFFTKEEAISKAMELQKEGLETAVSSVSAYSTLGWFSDPLLSSQLTLSEFSLTRLVIHETAHATIWFPGDVQFNESFASFVEVEGALSFYRQRLGESHSQFRRYKTILKESKELSNIFRKRTAELEAVYNSGNSDAAIRREKARLLAALRGDLEGRAPSFHHYDLRQMAAKRYNNAHLLSYRRYDSGQDFFRAAFVASGRDWGIFLHRMEQLRKIQPTERHRLMEQSR